MFAKNFLDDPIVAGGATRLRFTIDNSAALVPATDLDFSDTLPTGMTVGSPADAQMTCTGGTITAVPGANVVSYSGGTVAARSSCGVQVNVTSVTPGANVNRSSDLTSSLGNSGTASDTLTVNAPEIVVLGLGNSIADGDTTPDPADDTDFGNVLVGDTVSHTFTVRNDGTAELNVGTPMIDDTTNFSIGPLGASTIFPGRAATFVVTFQPQSAVALATTVRIRNNDGDEGQFDFAVAGMGDLVPSVEILGAPETFSDLTPFMVTFQFSEDVTGFELIDIAVGNGTASNFMTVDANTYTADITPSGYGTVTIDVGAGAALDLAGFPNLAAAQVVIGNLIPELTQQAIGDFIMNRARNILANPFSAIPFLNGNGPGFASVNATGYAGDGSSDLRFDFATSKNRIQAAFDQVDRMAATKVAPRSMSSSALAAYSATPAADAAAEGGVAGLSSVIGTNGSAPSRWDVWVDIHGAHSEAGPTSSDLWLGYFGAHVFLAPELLVGVAAQLDWADESNATTGSSANGLGWMVGPYLAAQLPGQPLYVEARAAWGQSSNSVTPIGTYSDDFDATRWLASGKVEGAFKAGNLTVSPAARVSYFHERQHSYTDSLANPIAAQTIALGEVRAGPAFSYNFGEPGGMTVVPMIGVDGVWNFGVEDAATSSGVLTGSDDVRARVNGGLTVGSAGGVSLTASGYYDGLGADDYEAYGGTARISVPLP